MTADAPGPASFPYDDVARLTDAQKSLRAQMLATEHWRSLASQVFASSMMLMLVVNTALVGLFVGALTYALTGSVGWAIAVGIVIAIAVFVLWMSWGYRGYRHVLRVHVPMRRSDGGGAPPNAAAR